MTDHGVKVPYTKCWRCVGRGHMGYLPGGAPIICRICHGVGLVRETVEEPKPTTIREKLRAAWQRFLAANVVDDDPWERLDERSPTRERRAGRTADGTTRPLT